jgi:hypothetical protein
VYAPSPISENLTEIVAPAGTIIVFSLLAEACANTLRFISSKFFGNVIVVIAVD